MVIPMPDPTPLDLPVQTQERLRRLPCWGGPAGEIRVLEGGITNHTYVVTDAMGTQRVVRVGQDIPHQHVMRFNEHAASRAAAELGISPTVRYAESDLLVIDFIPSLTLKPPQVAEYLPAIVGLMRRVHREMPGRLRGPLLCYWLFHVIRDTLVRLREHNFATDAATLLEQCAVLEAAVGPVDLVFCHNDWLAANLLDDGTRLWLIDWDYAGFNSALADLGSLAASNPLSEAQETWMLEHYYERPLDAAAQRRFLAMKAASLLKETLWSMNSEISSSVDFDFRIYSQSCLQRYATAWSVFRQA